MVRPIFSSPRLGHMSPISTPLSTTPSVESTVFASPITHIGVNLQVLVSLPFYLSLFLLLYWSHIVMTSGETSLSFISIHMHIDTCIAILIWLMFAFHLRLPYQYGFYLNLTILILLL